MRDTAFYNATAVGGIPGIILPVVASQARPRLRGASRPVGGKPGLLLVDSAITLTIILVKVRTPAWALVYDPEIAI